MDQGGGLQRLVGGFGRHPCGGELPQLVVHERQQVGRGLAVAGRGVEEAHHVGHSADIIGYRPQDQVNPKAIGPSCHRADTNTSTTSHSSPREV